MLSTFKKKLTLKAAIKQTKKARDSEGTKAEQLFKSAYEGYAEVVKKDIVLAEALYNWGFALLHHAKTAADSEAEELYSDAINKFNFCLLIEPNHLGAAIDGGVCYMDLARLKQVDINNELYLFAKKAFENAERIQKGSASFNIACIFGMKENESECLRYLELSKEFGSLPDSEEIIADSDLIKVVNKLWFISFMERLLAEPEPAVKDGNKIEYDEEGKVKREVKKDLRKFPEIERDGKVYDVEGNVIRTVATKDVSKTANKIKNEDQEEINKDLLEKEAAGFEGVALKTGFISTENGNNTTN